MGAQDEGQAWATIYGRARPDDDPELLATAAALLAERDDVGGVELRDATTLEFAVEIPEIVAYAEPPAIADVRGALAAIAGSLGLELTIDAEVHRGEAWREAWRRFYAPIPITGRGGERPLLLLRPSWIDRRPGDPPAELILDPGRAFGTGLHESTRLCLDLLVALLLVAEDRTGPRAILDLGCGSGVLGLAAAVLARDCTVTAIDRDPEAVAVTRENAARNDLGGLVTAGVGDPTTIAGRFNLVLANIRPEVLIPHAPAIAARVAPGGALILGGILDDEADAVLAAYRDRGLVSPVRVDLNGWCALQLRA